MVLVEGADGDGVTLDSNVVDVPGGESGCSGAAEQVVAAIHGTRESVDEGAHRLTAIGVAWTDHADGKRLRQALQASDIDDVVMVSELHAASALAQAVGRKIGCQRTALLFIEGSDATLAVVRTVDGAVVAVQSRALRAEDIVAELHGMVAALELTAEPPQAVFLMGAGLDMEVLAARIAEGTTLPVHAPEDADLALARGAALAAAGTPRFEAETVAVPADAAGLSGRGEPGPSDDTAAGPTQVAAAGYMAPLGYSAVTDDDSDAGEDEDEPPSDWAEQPDADEGADADEGTDEKPFLLVGSTLATIFVVGVVALVISLAVSIRPVVDQQPGEMRTPIEPTAAGKATDVGPSPALETIEAPVPVVREAPRTAFVPAPAARPQLPAPAAPVVPAPVMPAAAAPVPAAAPLPVPAAPAPVVTVPAAPAPAIPPIVLAPVIPILPPFVQAPIRIPTLPATVVPSTSAPQSSAPQSSAPQSSTQTPAPSTGATTTATVPSSTSAPALSTEVSAPPVSTEVSMPPVSTEISIPIVSTEVSIPTVSTEILIPSTSGAVSGGSDPGSGE